MNISQAENATPTQKDARRGSAMDKMEDPIDLGSTQPVHRFQASWNGSCQGSRGRAMSHRSSRRLPRPSSFQTDTAHRQRL